MKEVADGLKINMAFLRLGFLLELSGGLVGALQKKPLARQDDILRNSELINSHLEDIPELETKAVQEASENLSRSNLESKSRAQRSKVCG